VGDFGFGRFFFSFCNPFSFFILKKLNYEFSFVFLEFFFASIFRLIFLFFFYFFFFIYRGIFFFIVRSDAFYFIYFIFYFFYCFFRDLYIIYFFFKLFYHLKRIFIFWIQFFNGFFIFQFLFFNENLEEMFLTFKYAGRNDFFMQIQFIDEYDMTYVTEYMDVDFYMDNHFFAFQFSPFLDIDML